MADEHEFDMETMEQDEVTENLVPENKSVEDDSSDDSESDNDNHQDAENESKVAELTKQISQNPYMYDNHTEKIKVLREMGDLTRLREAREEMSQYFPLTEELWLDWLRDEIPLVSDEKERKKIEELFEKTFKDYQSVPIWLEYVQFAIGRMGEKDGLVTVRDAFERALTAIGLHVSQGANIWEAYREFESALLSGLMPQPGAVVTKEQEEAFAIQNQRVALLFKRQLALPLLYMQNTLKEYKEWLGEDDVDTTTQTAFNKALKTLEKVQSFEDRLLTVKTPNVEIYQDYIQHELKTDDPLRITCIYERALKDNCLVPELWLQYTKFLDKLKAKQQIELGYERAVRNCPWSAQLWVNYLLAMERQKVTFITMKGLADKALAVGFSQASDYLAVWCQYCDYLRRRIKWDEIAESEKELETFRLTVETAADFMFDNYGKDGDPEAALQQFWAFIEAKFCKNQEKARGIWNQIMQGGHGSEANMWLQYYRLERMFGDTKHCRKILQKALNSVTDWPESITQAYINFEREEGNLEQYDAAVAKCEAQMERVNARREKAAEQEQALQDMKKKGRGDKKKQRSDVVWKKHVDEAVTVAPNSKEISHKGKRKIEDSAHLSVFSESTDAPPTKKLKEKQDDQQKQDSTEELAHGESFQHDPSKDNVTAFVSNLDYSLEEDKLREVFQKCGEIVSLRLVRNYKGKSKGFGYVEFTNSNSLLQALKLDRESVEGRPMFVSRCEDRSTGKPTHQFKYATALEKNKLFIKGLPFTIAREAVETIFKEHGKIKEIRMVTYRNGSPKGIAYVEYDNEASASQAILKTDGLQIGEHTISVAISNPPERKTPVTARGDVPLAARVANLGSGKKETEFRGKARTQVSLVPRALQQLSKPVQPKGPSSASSNGGNANLASEVSDKKSSGAMSNEDFRKMLLKKE